ncbi:hypothetical protein ACFRAQ_36000 [Nocardia sp. NPDC056611]|uniref:hypothetical protein n=1 Tax=Nocardia sp. NPDC056611 TaxID=3345877 RepID=UPI0036705E9B
MPSPQQMQHIRCVSHGCDMWSGAPLAEPDIRALMRVHALQHFNRPITPADLGFSDQENE